MLPPPSPTTPSAQTPTPAMRQYLDAKRQHRDAIVFFRMGDFYEMFYEDALAASRALELTLTSRSKDTAGTAIPMCGVPYHAADGYIARLVKKGFRVAICEQVEDPRKAKGIVKREVVRVVSPGTLTDAAYLEAREPAFLMALAPAGSGSDRDPAAIGAALLDLSTGEFWAAEYAGPDAPTTLLDEIAVLHPRELVVPADVAPAAALNGLEHLGVPLTRLDAWMFDSDTAIRTLCEQLGTQTLDGFGMARRAHAGRAAGALVRYLRDTQKADLAHVRGIRFRETADHLAIDPGTLRHLAVVEGADGTRKGSLLDAVDATVGAMGARLLRGWLLRPLLSLERIQDRLDAVEELAFRTIERGRIRDLLKQVQDVERLVGRVALGTAGPRDLVALLRSLTVIPKLRALVADLQAPLVASLLGELDDLRDVRDAIESTVVQDPPALARDGGCIRDGVDAELDGLRGISRSGKQHIAAMEEAERARTGIGSLKVRYNRVFGYYIEVSKPNLHAVPADYLRKQTIAGAERFVTPALKEYEEKVLGADERILEREIAIFEALRARIAGEAGRIQDAARAIASLDVLGALAETATVYNYTKPHLHGGDELVICDGRHPVVERAARDPFVPNDLELGGDHQLMLLTGPNMGGKSTYLRQSALICLLAQAGSFVPARSAKLPVLDRLYARVGASDNIAQGQSTFMVEMQETANILHTATSRSLVLLDEIGRGTSTYDGLSIAWAVAEFLVTNPRARPKTLFATHYHELTDLAEAFPAVVNYHVVAREFRDDIVFLRKISPGRSDRSYGIQVARLAGLPGDVVQRAREILASLERDELSRGGRPSMSGEPRGQTGQLGLFESKGADGWLAQRLKEVDPDRLTPLEALSLLAELKRKVEE